MSVFPDISSDGRYVSFYSAATNLVPGGTTNQQVFRKDLQTGTVNLCSSDAAGVEGNGPSSWAQVSYDGRFVVFYAAATNLIAGGTTGQQVFRKDLQTGTVNLCSADAAGTEGNAGSSYPAINSDGRYTVFTSAATNLALGGTTGQQVFRKELAAPYTFYFAEGFTGANFQEYLTLGNPNAGPIQVTITYLFTGAAPQEQSVTVPGTSRATINVNSVVGSNKNVSLQVTSDSSFVAERPMYFNYQGAWSGGHDVVGANMASTNWYFAEGYTGSGFDEWVCVLNPGTITANLTFRFQTQEEGEKVITGRTVPANSRETFKANDLLSGGSFQTSLKLESDSAIVAERPMYFNYQGKVSRNWEGGHCVMGLPILSSQYYLAEGTTRGVFDEWLTLQNPNPTPINVQATYQLGPGQGAPIAKSYPIGANSRSSIYVPDEIGTEKDTSVYLTSNSPFLAERPMYFNYQGTASRGWQGGHCVIGAPSTAQDWFFAEGFTASNFEEWLTIQNPGSTDAQVQVIYYTQEAGALPVRTETIPADTRQTLLVNTHAGANYQLSARIVVISGPDLVVERPMYFNFNGWDGGSDVMGYNP
ncbi:MAG: hypothetical protein A2W01_12450 [Candidatus Solincola sediminis]|nr:MAG: hypothetical protein A2W01_12450 [Candidatus Solincola sediminis]